MDIYYNPRALNWNTLHKCNKQDSHAVHKIRARHAAIDSGLTQKYILSIYQPYQRWRFSKVYIHTSLLGFLAMNFPMKKQSYINLYAKCMKIVVPSGPPHEMSRYVSWGGPYKEYTKTVSVIFMVNSQVHNPGVYSEL